MSGYMVDRGDGKLEAKNPGEFLKNNNIPQTQSALNATVNNRLVTDLSAYRSVLSAEAKFAGFKPPPDVSLPDSTGQFELALQNLKRLYASYLIGHTAATQLNLTATSDMNVSQGSRQKVVFSSNPFYYLRMFDAVSKMSSVPAKESDWDAASDTPSIYMAKSAFDPGSKEFYPYYPLCMIDTESASITSTNQAAFAFNFEEFYPSELQYFVNYLYEKFGAQKVADYLGAQLEKVGLSIGQLGQETAFAPLTDTFKDFVQQLGELVTDPKRIFTIRGPYQWRGSEPLTFQISMKMYVPYVFRVINEEGAWLPFELLSPDSREDYAEVIQQAVLRYIILPMRRIKYQQMFGQLQGFSFYIARPGMLSSDELSRTCPWLDLGTNNMGINFFTIPGSYITIDFSPDFSESGLIPQSYKIEIKGNALFYALQPDLLELLEAISPVLLPQRELEQ